LPSPHLVDQLLVNLLFFEGAGHEHLVVAAGAADAGEAEVEVAGASVSGCASEL